MIALIVAVAMQAAPHEALRDNPRWRAAEQGYEQCLKDALDRADLSVGDADAVVGAVFTSCAPARSTARAAAQADRGAEDAERLMVRAEQDLKDATQAEVARRRARP